MLVQKKGIFRLWFVASIIWVVVVISQSDIYAPDIYRYYTDNDNYSKESAGNACNIKIFMKSYLNKKIIDEKSEYNNCLKTYKAPAPDFKWAAIAFLPPTLGVIFLYAALWSIYSVFLWIKEGFQEK